MQKETKHNDVFYPKHYINPPRRIRRIFRVKGKMIPKFLYYRMLYYGFGFIPFSTVWYSVCFLQSNPYIRAWLFIIYWYLLLCEITVFVILCLLFKYVKSKEQRQRIRQMKQKQRARKAKLKQDRKKHKI